MCFHGISIALHQTEVPGVHTRKYTGYMDIMCPLYRGFEHLQIWESTVQWVTVLIPCGDQGGHWNSHNAGQSHII